MKNTILRKKQKEIARGMTKKQARRVLRKKFNPIHERR